MAPRQRAAIASDSLLATPLEARDIILHILAHFDRLEQQALARISSPWASAVRELTAWRDLNECGVLRLSDAQGELVRCAALCVLPSGDFCAVVTKRTEVPSMGHRRVYNCDSKFIFYTGAGELSRIVEWTRDAYHDVRSIACNSEIILCVGPYAVSPFRTCDGSRLWEEKQYLKHGDDGWGLDGAPAFQLRNHERLDLPDDYVYEPPDLLVGFDSCVSAVAAQEGFFFILFEDSVCKVNSSLHLVLAFGERGKGPGQFFSWENGGGISVAGNELYVSDAALRVQVFDATTGSLLRILGGIEFSRAYDHARTTTADEAEAAEAEAVEAEEASAAEQGEADDQESDEDALKTAFGFSHRSLFVPQLASSRLCWLYRYGAASAANRYGDLSGSDVLNLEKTLYAENGLPWEQGTDEDPDYKPPDPSLLDYGVGEALLDDEEEMRAEVLALVDSERAQRAPRSGGEYSGSSLLFHHPSQPCCVGSGALVVRDFRAFKAPAEGTSSS
eukprot:7383835-Prymnesium_polylepis.1